VCFSVTSPPHIVAAAQQFQKPVQKNCKPQVKEKSGSNFGSALLIYRPVKLNTNQLHGRRFPPLLNTASSCTQSNYVAAAFRRCSFSRFSMSVATLKMPPVGSSHTAHRPAFFLLALCFRAQFSQK